ncbi:MAG: class A beta-lactamase-related serine hydrolase [Lysobacteraceae bacterium]|nr:MAG: class A beta-lactamase-related serine hydrolase [Xanthomonadaceae bacterium]
MPDGREPLSTTGLRASLLPMACGVLLCLASVAAAAAPGGVEPGTTGSATAAPAAAGSPQPPAERLQAVEDFLASSTDARGYLGAVSLVMADGKVVQSGAYGHRDLHRASPMREDSIFRVYSMTKTVTTVAVLILVEEGRLSLDAPIDRYLPEFSGLQRFKGGSADAPQLGPAGSRPSLRHLLTHTAGFATASNEEATRLLERADLHGSADLAEFSRRLARLPLAVEPGTRFNYDGTQIEVAARLVEVASGQDFEAFVQQRILAPLRMVDTGFQVPVDQRGRIVDLTVMGADGRLLLDQSRSALHPGERLNPYPGGAGGLYSTAPDFLRFCRMLLEGGSLDGVSILKPETVAQMWVNQLTFLQTPVTEFSDAEGFGLGGAVLLDPARKGRLGAAGQFGWSGAASTYFSIDPTQRTISILLLQHLPNGAANDLPRIGTPFYNLVQQALFQAGPLQQAPLQQVPVR